jgi:hypothetical protein
LKGIIFNEDTTFQLTGLTPEHLSYPSVDYHVSHDITKFKTHPTMTSYDQGMWSRDAVMAIHDQLLAKPFWWILEFLPVHAHMGKQPASHANTIKRAHGKHNKPVERYQ